MAAKTFEKYLYKRHSAVYASPLTTNLRLLDVLIKTDSRGLFPPRPVLQKVGSMLNLGTRGEEFDSTLERLREGLESFERTGGAVEEKDLFKWSSSHPNIDLNIRSAASITGTLLGGLVDANVYLSNSNGVNCCLQYMEVACVDKTKLLEIMLDPPQWKPDVGKRALKWPKPGFISNRSGLHELWIVYEILYASKLIVHSADSFSTGGEMRANLGQSSVVAGPGGSLRVSQTAGGSLEAHAAEPEQKFMFAFRTLCFQFDAEGEIVDTEFDAGKVAPVYRSPNEDESLYDDPRAQLGGLFLHPPTDDDDAEIDLQRLEIQISPHAGEPL